jgi:hypothetical protein
MSSSRLVDDYRTNVGRERADEAFKIANAMMKRRKRFFVQPNAEPRVYPNPTTIPS